MTNNDKIEYEEIKKKVDAYNKLNRFLKSFIEHVIIIIIFIEKKEFVIREIF